MRIRSTTVRGVHSPVAETGPEGAREAVVFVHGNPGPKEDWFPLMEALGDDVRAVAPDMPGYGDADRPRDFPYTVDGYAAHLAGVLGELGVERAHLVLHDFGGAWGLRWAAEHPGAVASFTLINIGILEGYRWHKFARIWRTPILGELFQLTATKPVFRAALNADNPKPFPPEFVDRVWSKADWGHKRAVLKLYRHTSDVGRMGASMAGAIRSIDAPTLVVWGKEDPYLPFTFAEKQRDYFQVESVHILEGCGHWPFVDEPDTVRDLVIPFLKAKLGAS